MRELSWDQEGKSWLIWISYQFKHSLNANKLYMVIQPFPALTQKWHMHMCIHSCRWCFNVLTAWAAKMYVLLQCVIIVVDCVPLKFCSSSVFFWNVCKDDNGGLIPICSPLGSAWSSWLTGVPSLWTSAQLILFWLNVIYCLVLLFVYMSVNSPFPWC